MDNNFYSKHQKTLLAQFDKRCPSFERVLGRKFSAAKTHNILELTHSRTIANSAERCDFRLRKLRVPKGRAQTA